MKFRFWPQLLIGLIIISVGAACTPKAAPTPVVDIIGTMSVKLASEMLTQTAAAASPTPLPLTVTLTPIPVTDTPSAEPTSSEQTSLSAKFRVMLAGRPGG